MIKTIRVLELYIQSYSYVINPVALCVFVCFFFVRPRNVTIKYKIQIVGCWLLVSFYRPKQCYTIVNGYASSTRIKWDTAAEAEACFPQLRPPASSSVGSVVSSVIGHPSCHSHQVGNSGWTDVLLVGQESVHICHCKLLLTCWSFVLPGSGQLDGL